tara:strand:+ start:5238 stop:5432 length:195 start_codon:yes stop_codon:yes gene_type:complete
MENVDDTVNLALNQLGLTRVLLKALQKDYHRNPESAKLRGTVDDIDVTYKALLKINEFLTNHTH